MIADVAVDFATRRESLATEIAHKFAGIVSMIVLWKLIDFVRITVRAVFVLVQRILRIEGIAALLAYPIFRNIDAVVIVMVIIDGGLDRWQGLR